MPASPSPRSYGLVIQPTGTFRLLTWNPAVSTPRHALRCNVASSANLTSELTAWHDPYAEFLGARVNTPASALLSQYAALPPRHGDVVVTAGTNVTGHALGLDIDQALALLERFLRHPHRVPHQRCR